MEKLKLLWLLIAFISNSAFAQDYQLDSILVAPGPRQELSATVKGEFIHGESSELSFVAEYAQSIASANAEQAAKAKAAREAFEKKLDDSNIPSQPALSASEQERRDKAGQAIVERTRTSLTLRREQPWNTDARYENESKRLKAVQYYLSVTNTTDRILRKDFANMADSVLGIITPDLSAEEKQTLLDIGAELVDFIVGAAASMPVDTFQSITGKHYRTWENLDTADHLMSIASVMSLGSGGAGMRGIKAIAKISEHLYGPGHAVLTRMPIFEKAATLSGAVRSHITSLGEAIEGTSIPRLFNLETPGQSFHVTPNATKHMAEYINRLPVSHNFEMRNNMILASFEAAVKDSVTSGSWQQSLATSSPVYEGGWELIFSQRETTDVLPVIKHALMK